MASRSPAARRRRPAAVHRIEIAVRPGEMDPAGHEAALALAGVGLPDVKDVRVLRSWFLQGAHDAGTLERAARYWYEDKPIWKRMMLRGMADDFSWNKPAQEYLALYRAIIPPERKPGECCSPCVKPDAVKPKIETGPEPPEKPEQPTARQEPVQPAVTAPPQKTALHPKTAAEVTPAQTPEVEPTPAVHVASKTPQKAK